MILCNSPTLSPPPHLPPPHPPQDKRDIEDEEGDGFGSGGGGGYKKRWRRKYPLLDSVDPALDVAVREEDGIKEMQEGEGGAGMQPFRRRGVRSSQPDTRGRRRQSP